MACTVAVPDTVVPRCPYSAWCQKDTQPLGDPVWASAGCTGSSTGPLRVLYGGFQAIFGFSGHFQWFSGHFRGFQAIFGFFGHFRFFSAIFGVFGQIQGHRARYRVTGQNTVKHGKTRSKSAQNTVNTVKISTKTRSKSAQNTVKHGKFGKIGQNRRIRQNRSKSSKKLI